MLIMVYYRYLEFLSRKNFIIGKQAKKSGNFANEVLNNLSCFSVRTSNGNISYINKVFEDYILKNSLARNFNKENNENKNALKSIKDINSSHNFNNPDISKHDNTLSYFNINNNYKNFNFLLKNNSTKNLININNNCDPDASFYKENNHDSNKLDVNLLIKTNDFLKNLIINQLNEELLFDNTEDNFYPINFFQITKNILNINVKVIGKNLNFIEKKTMNSLGGFIKKRANTQVKEKEIIILPLESNTNKKLINEHKTTYLGEFINVESEEYFQIHFKINNTENNIVTYTINKITKSNNTKITNPDENFKNHFFAKIAHEFKTPIISILGLIKKVKHQILQIKEPTIIEDDINKVKHLSKYMIFLISDIINYSQNTTDALVFSLQIGKINVKEILNFCKALVETLLIIKGKENNIKIVCVNDPLLENNCITLMSDSFRIKQLLLIFISNAVKFTRSGSIRISSKVNFEDDSSNNKFLSVINSPKSKNLALNNIANISLSVSDSGSGIKKDELNDFESFCFLKLKFFFGLRL